MKEGSMADFKKSEWKKIFTQLDGNEAKYGFPERRKGSVLLASFNIRDFGDPAKRSAGAWKLLGRICKRFDFIAVQEVEDDLSSLRQLKDLLGPKYALLYSDISGALPSEIGPISPHERLAFLYRTDRVRRGELASDITFDRSYIFKTLYQGRNAIWKAFEVYETEVRKKKEGTRKTDPYFISLPKFISFIRPPHAASFKIPGKAGAVPYEFVAANAHLLYGGGRKSERKREFEALVSWLFDRAKKAETMPVKNMILFGDLNLDFAKPEIQRPRYDARLKEINAKLESADDPADFNFPFLDEHPDKGFIRSNARLSETYDQIGIIRRDPRLPGHAKNAKAGTKPDGFDFGVVDFVRLFQDAVAAGKSVTDMDKAEKAKFIGRFEYDVSDHMPIWIRLPMPK
jgi:hypothetical protein